MERCRAMRPSRSRGGEKVAQNDCRQRVFVSASVCRRRSSCGARPISHSAVGREPVAAYMRIPRIVATVRGYMRLPRIVATVRVYLASGDRPPL